MGYPAISQRAVVSSLKSDLNEASKIIKLHPFGLGDGNYPVTISTDCSAVPDSATNICLKKTGDNTFVGYSANNLSNPKTFLLIASNGDNVYKITENTVSTQLENTMQPDVTPGAIVELHAAKANGGAGPGINSPLTTTWADTSGNGNNGTLTNITGSPWSGSGTSGDPYKLLFDGVNDYVSLGTKRSVESKMFTFETWVITPSTAPASYEFSLSEAGPAPSGDPSYPIVGITLSGAAGRARVYYRDSLSHSASVYGPVTNICDGLLHHILVTSNNSSAIVFVDGVAGTTADISSVVGGGKLKMDYGTSVGRASQGQYYWDGSILTARVYPFPLSPEQAAANYSAGADW